MEYNETVEDGVLIVGILLSESEYLLWQRDLNGEDSNKVYFEFNDQINGGYNHIAEISLMRDGVHIVKVDGTLEHFYFDIGFSDYDKFVRGLARIYGNNPNILDVVDK